ncbi:MAG: helix-turn-helix domain-containing protein [Thermoplasmata archaeon]|nr:helix-turn-helix domain-containing protein [Thermoplasmata archaeon]
MRPAAGCYASELRGEWLPRTAPSEPRTLPPQAQGLSDASFPTARGRSSERGGSYPEAGSAATGDSAESTLVPKRVVGLEPTTEELQISARLLLHIASQPRYERMETAPESLTQAGMASALGSTQAAVSNALRRLVDGGALRVERYHVRHKLQRLKVYQLTDLGEALVRHIRSTSGR